MINERGCHIWRPIMAEGQWLLRCTIRCRWGAREAGNERDGSLWSSGRRHDIALLCADDAPGEWQAQSPVVRRRLVKLQCGLCQRRRLEPLQRGRSGNMRQPTVAAMRLTLAEAIAGEAAATAAVEEAIDSLRRAGEISYLIHCKRDFLNSFQGAPRGPRTNLESIEKAVFPFASCRGLKYLDGQASPKGSSASMIVCSCNVLSDDDVRNAVSASEDLPRNAKQIYGCLGCSAECGRCARTIKTIIDEALGPARGPATPDVRTARRWRNRIPASTPPSSRSPLPEDRIPHLGIWFSAGSCPAGRLAPFPESDLEAF